MLIHQKSLLNDFMANVSAAPTTSITSPMGKPRKYVATPTPTKKNIPIELSKALSLVVAILILKSKSLLYRVYRRLLTASILFSIAFSLASVFFSIASSLLMTSLNVGSWLMVMVFVPSVSVGTPVEDAPMW